MDILDIVRLETSKRGTLGVLKINKKVFCYTLEREYANNERNISCIPAQQYMCERVETASHGEVFQVLDVPGRSGILFHVGNTVEDTQGCILLGNMVSQLGGKRVIARSGAANYRFMERLKGVDFFHLTISEAF